MQHRTSRFSRNFGFKSDVGSFKRLTDGYQFFARLDQITRAFYRSKKSMLQIQAKLLHLFDSGFEQNRKFHAKNAV